MPSLERLVENIDVDKVQNNAMNTPRALSIVQDCQKSKSGRKKIFTVREMSENFTLGQKKNDIWRNMIKSYIFTHQARKLSEKTAVSGP